MRRVAIAPRSERSEAVGRIRERGPTDTLATVSNTSRTRILVLRHGESEWNALGRWQGQADPPLTDLGRAQAEAVIDKLGSFDLIAASDLQRAHETALIIARGLGSEVHLVMPELRETHIGEWEGLTHDEIKSRFPGFLESYRRPPSFESDEAVVDRFHLALARIARTCPGGSALVVAHGGVIRVMRRRHELHDQRIPNLGGCEFTLIADEGGGARLEISDIIDLVPHGDIPDTL